MKLQEIKKEVYDKIPKIMQDAGKIALKLRKNLKVSYKSNTGRKNSDIVTNADIKVQEFILTKLLKTKLKECKIFCEENTKNVKKFPKTSKWLLTLDPIDGTLAYAESNSSHWQIIIQLKTRYKFLITMIYYPVEDSFLIIDKNLKLNGELIKESSDKKQYVAWDELPGPSERAQIFAKKKKLMLKKRKKTSESGFITYAKKKFLGMYRLRLNTVDSMVWAHITQAIGGKSYELISSKIIGENFDFFSVNE